MLRLNSSDQVTVSGEDVVREFLIESNENLNRLDREIVELEQKPEDAKLLASVFRTFHTIKGSCGFLGFTTLERVSHEAESLLSQLRSGKPLSPGYAGLILETVDAIRRILLSIESSGAEGAEDCSKIIRKLRAACDDPLALDSSPLVENGTAEAVQSCAAAAGTIRVDVGLLDKLMNLVGELVLARNQVLQFGGGTEGALNATSQRLNLITTELQENVMKTRMQPVGVVWSKLPRLVRDTAQACGKSVKLEMDGSETELDKTIIEAIKDPITHLVRNGCDHGIEPSSERERAGKPSHGTVSLKAYHEGGQVTIEIADDGAGVALEQVRQLAIQRGAIRAEDAARLSEREALQLIFLPGLSTASKVTNVSGRGVGMDVVRSNVEKIGGVVDISSVPGKGTVVKLKIPLTLAIIPGLVVRSGGERFVIPQASLLELIRLDSESAGKIERVHGTPVYRRRGKLLPIAYLDRVLKIEPEAQEALNIVVLQAEERQFGLVVDAIQDTQEIVVKPLGKQLKGLSVYAGATIMGDGRVALILDVLGVGQSSGVPAGRGEQVQSAEAEPDHAASECERLMLFQAGVFPRLAVPLAVVARLEEFPHSAIEYAGGQRVVQYRGSILNLVSLSEMIDPGACETASARDPIQAIVFSEGGQSIGVMVDQILDIVEDAVVGMRDGGRRGILGSAVIGKRVTDLLDVAAVMRAATGARGGTEPDSGGLKQLAAGIESAAAVEVA
jgi:two-component system, chemotaxis family, sensor kinase CheA